MDTSPELARQVERRRTFAIISHPDAGKTTLTEKLLLFGGAAALEAQLDDQALVPLPKFVNQIRN